MTTPSKFTPEQRQQILDEARRNIATPPFNHEHVIFLRPRAARAPEPEPPPPPARKLDTPIAAMIEQAVDGVRRELAEQREYISGAISTELENYSEAVGEALGETTNCLRDEVSKYLVTDATRLEGELATLRAEHDALRSTVEAQGAEIARLRDESADLRGGDKVVELRKGGAA